ncbi:MAG: transglutaminase-like cysteine peptidase [Aliarcobacter sp.]|nr:transglutaminase-like cysteine peptidase [Aliarcobacter sp.]
MKKTFIIIVLGFFSIIYAGSFYKDSILKKIDNKYGKFTTNRFLLLKEKIESVKNKSEFEKISTINDFFNKVKYAPDIKVWNEKDYWATPYEFLAKDKGDSEDFVFAKYFTLVEELNISEDKLYFTYVKSLEKKVSYMVLTYYETKKSVPIILDSVNYKALPATKRPDIVPIYSFNAKNAGVGGDKAGQSLKFRNLIRDIKGEKI